MQERRFRGAGVIVGLAVLWLVTGLRAEIQAPQQQTTSPASSTNPLGGSSSETGIDEASIARLKHRQEMAVLDDRHKHMVADADKLLEMATALKNEVDKSSKNETSISAYNKADAIERLAHDVKQRLKN